MLRHLVSFVALLSVLGCAREQLDKRGSVSDGSSSSNSETVCSNNSSGSGMSCENGNYLPLPPTFPHSKECNQCLTKIVDGVASVKCPNGLEFSFSLLKGDTGAKGDKGDTGAKGANGTNGTNGANGTSCTVTTDGWVRCTDGSNYKLLQGPKGDKGDTGAKGDAGAKGDTGAKGDNGAAGTNGAQGPKGDTGANGQKGGSCHVGHDEYNRVVISCDDGTREVMGSCGGMGCWSFGARGNVYTIPTTTTMLPNLDNMTPEESVTIPRFDIFNRAWSLGFPNDPARLEWYAIRFRGYIDVPACAQNKCYFRTTSDDGARFYIDNVLTVNNDGLHPPQQKTGCIALLPGWHALKMDWFQGPRTQIALALEISTDGGLTYRLVEQDELKFSVQ